MSQIIDPVKAAHAIASVISDRYAKNSQVHNLDDPSFYETVKKVSQVYSNAYDVAYDYISSQNEEIINDPE